MNLAIAVVYIWMTLTAGVLLFCILGATIGQAWSDMDEYDRMKIRGYTLMKNDKGEEMWVGYGD
jgi:hypothetical protein